MLMVPDRAVPLFPPRRQSSGFPMRTLPRIARSSVLLGLLVGSPAVATEPPMEFPDRERPFVQATSPEMEIDRTSTLQGALDEGRGGLVLGPGVFLISKPLTIDLSKGRPVAVVGHGSATLRMAGPGPALDLIGHHGGTADPKSVTPAAGAERMPTVDGVAILGDHPEADGIRLARTLQATLSRVHIRKVRHGVHLVDRNRNVTIDACHVYENSGIGVFLDNVNLHQTLIGDTHISYCRQGGVVVRRGEVRNLHIGNCDIESNMEPTPTESPAANVLIDLTHGPEETFAQYQNTVAEGSITGCTLQHVGTNPHGANIRFLGREGYPVNTFSVAGNVFSDAGYGLDFDRVRSIVAADNLFFDPKPTDVRVRRSSQLVLTGNVFDPRYYEGERDQTGGLVFEDVTDLTIGDSQIAHHRNAAASLLLTRCARFTIQGVMLRDCPAGLHLTDCERGIISGCQTSDIAASPDVRLESCRQIVLANNLFEDPPADAAGK